MNLKAVLPNGFRENGWLILKKYGIPKSVI